MSSYSPFDIIFLINVFSPLFFYARQVCITVTICYCIKLAWSQLKLCGTKNVTN